MKPRITFDDSAIPFLFNIYHKKLDKKGYIRCMDRKNKIYKIQKCIFCKKSLTSKNFGGITKYGFFCNNQTCLIEIFEMLKKGE